MGPHVLLDFGYLMTLAQHYNRAGTFIDGDANLAQNSAHRGRIKRALT